MSVWVDTHSLSFRSDLPHHASLASVPLKPHTGRTTGSAYITLPGRTEPNQKANHYIMLGTHHSTRNTLGTRVAVVSPESLPGKVGGLASLSVLIKRVKDCTQPPIA